MTGARFVWRGVWHFRGSYLGVLAGSTIGATVWFGALMAGNSVSGSLRAAAAARIGGVGSILVGGDRLVRAALADDLAADRIDAAPVLALEATASVPATGRSTGAVQVLGVDDRFWRFAPDGGAGGGAPHGREIAVNEVLAADLGVAAGDPIVLRFAKPRMVPAEAPLAGEAARPAVLGGSIAAVLGADRFGGFHLAAAMLPPATVFVPIERLQQAVEQPGKANLILFKRTSPEWGSTIGWSGTAAGPSLADRLAARCTLEDLGLSLVEVPRAGAWELRSERVFFDHRLDGALTRALPDARPVLTYLAVTLAANGREIPYSMVTAAAPDAAPFLPDPPGGAVLNDWAAADLGAAPGDELRIDYFAVGSGQSLELRSATLPVAGVVALGGLAGDPQWMPDFPGVAEAESTTDWDPGFPLDFGRIRDKDEEYWDRHRGTPKVFLPLDDARRWFGNRWGETTALRVPAASAGRADVEQSVLAAVTPADAGLLLRDLHGEALAAADSPVDFAGLLLGMSVFLIGASGALTAMLFRFHIEQRNAESGLLATLGVPPRRVLRWRLGEGACVVVVGAVAGIVIATLYTRGLLAMLGSIWGGATGHALFQFHADPATVAGGAVGFIAAVVAAIHLTMRRQARKSASLRLEAATMEMPPPHGTRAHWWALGFAGGGVGALAAAPALGPLSAFFLGGLALLGVGLAACRWRMRRRAGGSARIPDTRRLAELNSHRRPTRSLVVVGCLAAGVFLVASVTVFQKPGVSDWRDPSSGTGGFAFWIETTSPPPRADPSRPHPLDLGPDASRFEPLLPLRVGAGDDADCFNLHRVARPRLLAADTTRLESLGAFTIKRTAPGCTTSWATLRDGATLRAFVDETTLTWALKRKPGDTLEYLDEWGRTLPVLIAGTLADSIFQGSLVVDEQRFLDHFPSAAGPRLFLTRSAGDLAADRLALQRALAPHGPRVTPAADRLAAFHQVENGYIAIFHVLGGLGVVLGSAGLGLLTTRNLAERRNEFKVLDALGIPPAVTREIVFRETARLVRWGLGIGLAAALVAVLPILPSTGLTRPLAWLAAFTALIAGNAWLWSWLACRRGLATPHGRRSPAAH